MSLVRFTVGLALGAALLAQAGPAYGETGYELWLRYRLVDDAALLAEYRKNITSIVVEADSPTARVTRAELRRGLGGLLGAELPVAGEIKGDGAVLAGTPSNSPLVAALDLGGALADQGTEGYVIRSVSHGSHRITVIASTGETGVLYGAFHFLRLLQTGQSIQDLAIAERPVLQRRLLNHWDNLDGTIERGYAGGSLWRWDELPGRVDPRIEDYARANASLGINGTVINNVNANPLSLSAEYIAKAAALADTLRPYGIRLYLSANFDSPRRLGGLPTADPLDPAVIAWWKAKADEIYGAIPDFGGFLVKADSEGQPGPYGYGRDHADGANVLADAVAPHGGIVMWRAFIYDADVDPDRVKRAYKEFVPLDGRFRRNVFVQVKNGPLDFQPREPFHPLFGAMPKTPLMAELQITQEYFGHSTHLVYLAPMWNEFLRSDTYAKGPGTLVADVLEGRVHGYHMTGMAGVANTGTDRNWTGHHMAQANWYAYGRLAWNPRLDAGAIADEWIPMTWGRSPEVVSTIRSMLLDSYETYVRYTMPLGFHHLIGGDHYAPMPENPDPRREDWSAIYYHRADELGVGFDRTRKGSAAVDQYHPPLNDRWNDPATTPENLLLWFHRLPWDYRLASGQTLWEGIVAHYRRGADEAKQLLARWETLRGKVDAERFEAVAAKLRTQAEDAAAWRDHCLRYFSGFSRRPM